MIGGPKVLLVRRCDLEKFEISQNLIVSNDDESYIIA
jgi:hypothetical protein